MTDKVSEPESKDTVTGADRQKVLLEAMDTLSEIPLDLDYVLDTCGWEIERLPVPSQILVKLFACVGHVVLEHIAHGGGFVFTDPPRKEPSNVSIDRSQM